MKITPVHIVLFMVAIIAMANAGLNPMFLFFGAFFFISSAGRRGGNSAQKRRQEQQRKIREAQARAQRRYNPVPQRDARYQEHIKKAQKQQEMRGRLAKALPYKTKGVEEYKNYHYDDAIENFQKALEYNDKDVATHFNLACSYSLTEQADKAFEHLDKAVQLGFNDADKINTHDAFAFLRVQDKFQAFKNNGYRLGGRMKQTQTVEVEQEEGNLLENLKRLAEKRQKGLLSEQEFLLEKKKLLR